MKEAEWKKQLQAKCDGVVAGYTELNAHLDTLDSVTGLTADEMDELAAVMQCKIERMCMAIDKIE